MTHCQSTAMVRRAFIVWTLALSSNVHAQGLENPSLSPAAESLEPAQGAQEEILGALLLTRSSLKALLNGKLSADLRPSSVIGMPINSLRDLESTKKEITAQRQRLSIRQAELQAEWDRIEAENSDPPNTVDEAERPLSPVEPEAPKVVNARRPTRAERQSLAEYQIARETFDREQKSFLVSDKQFSEAADAYEKELLDVRSRRTSHLAPLKLQQKIVAVRDENASLRLRALSDLEKTFGTLQQAGKQIYQDLNAPRLARRNRVIAMGLTSTALFEALERLNTLAHMVKAGRVIGFAVDQESIAEDLSHIMNGLDEKNASLRDLASSLNTLIENQEAEAHAIRQSILRETFAADKQQIWDRAFAKHLGNQRKLSLEARNLSAAIPELSPIRNATNALVATPASIGTTAQAGQELAKARATQRSLSNVLQTLSGLPQLWSLAHEQELATLYTDLASENARREAFKLSNALIDDLRTEATALMSAISGWGARKTESVLALSAPETRTLASKRVGRWLLALVVLVLGVFYRRQSRLAIRFVVTRLAKTSMFRQRVATLVRWATLGHALAPAAMVLGTSYFAMWIFGWNEPEIQILRVIVGGFGIYTLLERLLQGITTPVSRSRPALIPLSATHRELLIKTFQRFGFFLTLAIVVDRTTRRWLGEGPLQFLLDYTVLAWVLGVLFWAAMAWRIPLATVLLSAAPENSTEARAGRWMSVSRVGAMLSLPVLIRIAVSGTIALGRQVLAKGGGLAYLKAMFLKRRARKGEDSQSTAAVALPQDYTIRFPLRAEQSEVSAHRVSRAPLIALALEQISCWQADKTGGSIVILGEHGMGKTTLLGMLESEVAELPVSSLCWTKKTLSEGDVLWAMRSLCDAEPESLEHLIAQLNAGPERVVFLDDAHDVFLRDIDGYLGFDALVQIVNGTSQRIFWVLTFNSYSWRFINASRKRVRYFRTILEIPKWSAKELQELVGARTKSNGYSIEFDATIVDRDTDDDFRLVEGGESYFRLLADISGGNPRIAIYLWLRSLELLAKKSLRVRLVREPKIETSGLSDEMLYAMAAVFQHENLSVEELSATLRIRNDDAAFILQFLRERCILEPAQHDKERSTYAPRYYRSAMRTLRSKHLLTES